MQDGGDAAGSKIESLQQTLNDILLEDPASLLIIHRVKRLKQNAEQILWNHLSQFGQVKRIALTGSEVRSKRPKNTWVWSKKISNIAFGIMADSEGVARVLNEGNEHWMGMFYIRIDKFTPSANMDIVNELSNDSALADGSCTKKSSPLWDSQIGECYSEPVADTGGTMEDDIDVACGGSQKEMKTMASGQWFSNPRTEKPLRSSLSMMLTQYSLPVPDVPHPSTLGSRGDFLGSLSSTGHEFVDGATSYGRTLSSHFNRREAGRGAQTNLGRFQTSERVNSYAPAAPAAYKEPAPPPIFEHDVHFEAPARPLFFEHDVHFGSNDWSRAAFPTSADAGTSQDRRGPELRSRHWDTPERADCYVREAHPFSRDSGRRQVSSSSSSSHMQRGAYNCMFNDEDSTAPPSMLPLTSLLDELSFDGDAWHAENRMNR